MVSDRPSPSAFRRLLTHSLIVPPALLVILAMVFLGQIMYLLSAADWVDHTDQVIAKGNHLTSLLVDRESRLRGYLVTADRVFLDLYEAEEINIAPAFESLKELVSDNPAQVERLKALQVAQDDWQNFARNIIALRSEGKDYMALARTLGGKKRMDLMRVQLAQFIQVEEELRITRTHTVRRATWFVSVTSLSLTCLFGGALAIFGRRQLLRMSSSYGHALSEAETRAEALSQSARRFETLHEIDRAILEATSIPSLIRSALCRVEREFVDHETFVVLVDSFGRQNQTISDMPGLTRSSTRSEQ